MNRFIAGVALAAILAFAIYYNVRSPGETPRSGARPSPRALSSASPVSNPVPITPSDRLDSLSIAGTIRADRQAVISSRQPGHILAVLARDGETVLSGQALVRLDVGNSSAQVSGAEAGIAAAEAQYRKAVGGKNARRVEMDAQMSQAEGELRAALTKQRQAELALRLTSATATADSEKAEAGVRQAEAAVRQADAGYRQAAETLKRTEFLYQHGGVARADVEGAQAQADIAKAQRESAQAALDQARVAARPAAQTVPLRQQVSEADVEAANAGVRQAREAVLNARRARTEALRMADADIAAARAQVEQAKAGKSQVETQLGQGTLTAPFAGLITQVSARAGENAQPGQPLMTIISSGSVYMEAMVPARSAGAVRAGMNATVRPDSDPSPPLAGRVAEVLTVSSDGRSVPVKIRFHGRTGLVPGTGATAEIALRPSR